MATFTNYATLSYSGGSTDSNTVTGELIEVLTVSKTAITGTYTAKGHVTYAVSLRNSGAVALSGLRVTDDLGGYVWEGTTVYPLAYADGTAHLYVNGVLQSTPTVEGGAPLVVSGIDLPAGGQALLIYETAVTGYAPLGTQAAIVNNAVVDGGGLANPVTATATVGMEARADLNVSKSLTPTSVPENGQLTYTFVITNEGSVAAEAADAVQLSDRFSPRLTALTVRFEGQTWAEGVQYTYAAASGEWATVAGRIVVPAATYRQNTDGSWSTEAGSVTLTVSGTVS